MESSTSLSVSCARNEGARRNEAMSRETKARNLEFMANKLATRLPCRNLAVHEGQSSCEPSGVVMASRELRPPQLTFESKNSRPHLRSSVPDCSDQRPNPFRQLEICNHKFQAGSKLDRPHPVRLFSHGQTPSLIKLGHQLSRCCVRFFDAKFPLVCQ